MTRPFQTRCLLITCLLVLGLSGLSARLLQIQLVDRTHYAENQKKAYARTEKLPAMRGMIVDRNDEVLAKSLPVCSMVVDKKHLRNPEIAGFALAYEAACQEPNWRQLDSKARERRVLALRRELLQHESPEVIVEKHLALAINILARPLGLRREEMRTRIEEPKGSWITIAKEIPADVGDRLRDIIKEHWLQGFEIESGLRRWYTAPNLATHVIGFTGEREIEADDGSPSLRSIGVFGVEASLEKYLAGRDGWRKHQRDSRGLLMPGDASSLQPPRAGLTAQLSLDMGIQAIVEEEIDAAMKEYESQRAAIVVIEPKSGEILAMASRPHFDLNRRQDVATTGFNFALQAIYEPGSTFKIIPTAGVINEGLATPQTSIFCHNGLYQEGAIRVPDHHPYGSLTLAGVLAKSSNIGAYKFARQLGMNRFYQYVDKWGFGHKTGIQLSGESGGMVRKTGNAVDFSRASYGYALNVTPLQMAMAYGVLANDGKLMRPHVVRALVANDGTMVERFEPEVVRTVLKPGIAAKMRGALEKVVEKEGTAPLAAVPGFKVAGKTGTAKKHNPHGGYFDNRYTVSFAGMMPAKDPAFVAVVVIDDPQTHKVSRYGGTIAAPVFGKMAARIAAQMNLQPTEPAEAALARTPQP